MVHHTLGCDRRGHGHLAAYRWFSLVKYVQYDPRCASGRAPRSTSRRLPPRAQRAGMDRPRPVV